MPRFHYLVPLIVAVSGAAFAQPRSFEEKHAAYREGYAAVREKDWTTAYRIFERLWREEQTYDVALNLGQAEYQLGKYRDAAEHLAFAEKRIPLGETRELRERIQRALSQVRKQVGSLTVIADRNGAEVRVDGTRVGTTPIDVELFVEPGAHSVEVDAPGYRPSRELLEIAAGEQRSLVFKLDPLPAQASTPGASTPSVASTGPGQTTGDSRAGLAPPMIVLLAGGALTAAAATTGIVFAMNGSAAGERAERSREVARWYGPNACGAPAVAPGETCVAIERASNERADAYLAANVAFAVAGVAAVATAVTFAVWPRSRTAAVRVVPAVGGLHVIGEL